MSAQTGIVFFALPDLQVFPYPLQIPLLLLRIVLAIIFSIVHRGHARSGVKKLAEIKPVLKSNTLRDLADRLVCVFKLKAQRQI